MMLLLMLLMIMMQFAGDEKAFVVKKPYTLAELKKQVEVEEGVKPARQSFYFGPYPLEDDNLNLDELLKRYSKDYGSTLDVLFPLAGNQDICCQTNCWIVFGPSHKTFEMVDMQEGDTKTLNLSKKKLGIVTEKKENQEGKPVCTVDRYR